PIGGWSGCIAQVYQRAAGVTRLIAEEFSEGAETFDIVADGLEAGGERDREQEAGRTPEEAPDHQGKGDHQRIEVDARADDLRVEDIERDEVEHGYGHHDQDVDGDRVHRKGREQ